MTNPPHNNPYQDEDNKPPSPSTSLSPLLHSPLIPTSPAPAYTALPYRDTDFHFAPLLHGRPGEVELETVDGKRFLVHKRVLEAETTFFHIYYGFVPLWRLNRPNPSHGPPHPAFSPISQNANPGHPAQSGLNNILCLPKFLNNLRHSCSPSPPPPPFTDSSTPPTPPPKDHPKAPTPTTSPYTWSVPETSQVLLAFLSLIYPTGTIVPINETMLVNLDITSWTIRAAMGYQSSKGLNTARDRLGGFVRDYPVEVYAMACFFKFTDLAKMASELAVRVSMDQWGEEAKVMMGKEGLGRLLDLQQNRLDGLKRVLQGFLVEDSHSVTCVRRGMMEEVWKSKVKSLMEDLRPESDLLELLSVDLRGGHCGECLVNFGETVQRCLYEAKALPRTI